MVVGVGRGCGECGIIIVPISTPLRAFYCFEIYFPVTKRGSELLVLSFLFSLCTLFGIQPSRLGSFLPPLESLMGSIRNVLVHTINTTMHFGPFHGAPLANIWNIQD